jgi:hypothetical protein
VGSFLVPGMGHCGGGPGVNTFESIGTLEKWVERGIAPDQMMGTGAQGFTRPPCPYPQYADYEGTGDLKNAANLACKALLRKPKRSGAPKDFRTLPWTTRRWKNIETTVKRRPRR